MRSDAFASGLLALGLEPGIASAFGPQTARMDDRAVCDGEGWSDSGQYQSAYRLSELEHVLRAVGCRALITAARFKTSDYIAMIRELAPELGSGGGELHSARLPELRHVISIAGEARWLHVRSTGSQREASKLVTNDWNPCRLRSRWMTP